MAWLIAIIGVLNLMTSQPATAKLDDLRFLQGAWSVERNGTITEEFWSALRGGTMMGAGRTIKGDKTVFFEHLRIEQRGDDIFFVGQPKGQQPTDFKLVSFDGKRAVFENPQHDFPTKVIYEKIDDDTLRASIEGVQNGQKRGTSWEYKRAK